MMKFISIKSINKAWAIPVIALLVGLLAAWGASRYLSNRVAAIDSRAKGEMTSVVVAKSDLQSGEVLGDHNLAVREIPREYAHSDAVMPEQFDVVDGQKVAYSVKSGEMLLWSLLAEKQNPAFSTMVAAGRRAITVPVDEINSISGMLEPGDFIDLMVTMDKGGKKKIFPLLQNVKVLATGQKPLNYKQSDTSDAEANRMRYDNYATVTLDADPQEAQAVIMAREVGKVTALLRNPEDKNDIGGMPARLATIFEDGKAPVTLTIGQQTAQVPVMYGDRREFPPEALQLGKKVPPPVEDGGEALEAMRKEVAPLLSGGQR
jgi:pilus assembly protein CpaB